MQRTAKIVAMSDTYDDYVIMDCTNSKGNDTITAINNK